MPLLRQLGRDFRQACRAIAAAPGVAAVIIGSLGVGIGVNTTVFSWIESQVLNPMPGVRDGGSFRLIEPITESGGYAGASWLEFRDLQPRLTTFSDLIAFRMAPFTIGETEWTERAYGQFVSPNYFTTLGLKPASGRFFDASSDEAWQPGGDPVVVVSHTYWQSKLAGAADIAGRAIRVNDRPMTIVGVAPKGFQGTILGLSFDLWVPATLSPALVPNSAELKSRGSRGYSIIGRLQPQAAVANASRQVDDAMRELARVYPDTNTNLRAEVLPFSQSPRGPQRMVVGALAILQAAMLLVLLAVCGNTANLTLARASARRREIGVRLALGASRLRVVSLLLMESLLLGVLGAAVGAALAFWGTDALRAVPMPTPMGLTVRFQTGIDGTALAFAMILGLASGVIFGLAPAWQLARTNPQASLRATAVVAGRSRLRDILMVVEVALALVVLVVAALFLESFNDTRTLDPGFKRDGVLLAAYDLSDRSAGADAPGFAARLLESVSALPAVESVAIATAVPLDIHGMPVRSFTVEGHARADGQLDEAAVNTVTPDYFRTMGIAMRTGSGFAGLRDPSAPPQVVVNEAFVRRYLADVEPLGRRITSGSRAYVVSGIVANSLQNAFGEPPTPALYFSLRDRPSATAEIHIRTRAGAEATIAPDVRRVVRALDPALPLYNVRTLNDHVDANLVFRRIPARIFAVLAPLLLVVAATGIYAIVAYAVSQRRVEMGVRLALGATRTRVAREIVSDVLRVAGVGAGAGWIVAFMIDRVMSGGSIDVRVFVGVPIVLLLVAALASYLPARRAGRIDPMIALKQE